MSERLIGDESREVDVFRKIKDLYAMLKCYPAFMVIVYVSVSLVCF